VKTVTVIFEDHNLARMRPVSWGTPVFEIRCGMFSTRERVDLCSGGSGGVLLGRSFLRGLNGATSWKWGAEEVAALAGGDSRFLFINGILAPDASLVTELLALGDGPEFCWRNEQGLMAALVDPETAVGLANGWAAWEQTCANRDAWRDPAREVPAWSGDIGEVPSLGSPLQEGLDSRQNEGPRWVWGIVPATSGAIAGDLELAREAGSYHRQPFGITALNRDIEPVWAGPMTLKSLNEGLPGGGVEGLTVDNPGRVFVGGRVDLAPGTALNTAAGPIILEHGVTVMPHCYLEGPLFIGAGSLVKPGSRLHGESSFGIVNRLAGEVGESTFGDFANKQHEGFIGHAVLGSWINLGAMTTCSDLKNNYGQIRVDLGAGPVDTGSRFVGLMLGDHAKTAIGTLFNTGTCVGFASNIFGPGMPPKFVGNFRWGGQEGSPAYAVDRALDTAAVVMGRRGCAFTPAHLDLFRVLGG